MNSVMLTIRDNPRYLNDIKFTKMTQLFNKDVKSLMTFNAPATPHKGGGM